MVDVLEPNKRSSDYLAMVDYWRKVATVNEGVDAMRDAGDLYLPRFESESDDQFKQRVETAKFTNIYGDIVENLADRPFANEVQLDASPRITAMAENIDGQGNNLHNFASVFFRSAMDYGVDWIFVDYTRTNANTIDASGRPRRKTLQEERESGARPYWVRVSALEMIAVYSAIINGVEEFVHCRIEETFVERAGWDEVTVVQVRELSREPLYDEDGNIIAFDNATFRVWQQKEQVSPKKTKTLVWEVIDEGDIAIGIIPITPLVIGRRHGNGWRITPAMRSVLDLQMEYYEAENGVKNVKKLTAYPMLTANGVIPEIDPQTKKPVKAPVGPRAVLYGGQTEHGAGSWQIIEPAGSSLTFLSQDLKDLAKEMRELGRQPLTQQTGVQTSATAEAQNAKGASAIQRWALALKDTLENAMYFTALWLKETKEPTIQIDTNFDLSEEGDDGFTHVEKMRETGDLSQETLWEEAKRRRILSDEFDEKRERDRLEEEMPSDEEVEASLTPKPDEELSPSDDIEA